MLVNNPMGSRRRRRFYHRAGVVPVPGEHVKDDYYHYEMEPFEYSDEEEFHPTSRITENGKRRVNFITVSSLHSRLLDIIESMIALAEAEDREKAKKEGTGKDADSGKEIKDERPDSNTGEGSSLVEAGSSGLQTSISKAEKE